MREFINILKYGFMIFLLFAGIVSIFNNEPYFVNSVNSLSIPIFAFSISILLVKSNQYARNEIFKQIQNKSITTDNLKKDIDKKEKIFKETVYDCTIDECKKKIEKHEHLSQLYKDSLISLHEYNFFCNYFITIDYFTRLFNLIATLSFSWCLLSLTGLFKITGNFAWVNIFSLALVFFDFFILDDLISKMIGSKIKFFREQAKREISKNEE